MFSSLRLSEHTQGLLFFGIYDRIIFQTPTFDILSDPFSILYIIFTFVNIFFEKL